MVTRRGFFAALLAPVFAPLAAKLHEGIVVRKTYEAGPIAFQRLDVVEFDWYPSDFQAAFELRDGRMRAALDRFDSDIAAVALRNIKDRK